MRTVSRTRAREASGWRREASGLGCALRLGAGTRRRPVGVDVPNHALAARFGRRGVVVRRSDVERVVQVDVRRVHAGAAVEEVAGAAVAEGGQRVVAGAARQLVAVGPPATVRPALAQEPVAAALARTGSRPRPAFQPGRSGSRTVEPVDAGPPKRSRCPEARRIRRPARCRKRLSSPWLLRSAVVAGPPRRSRRCRSGPWSRPPRRRLERRAVAAQGVVVRPRPRCGGRPPVAVDVVLAGPGGYSSVPGCR